MNAFAYPAKILTVHENILVAYPVDKLIGLQCSPAPKKAFFTNQCNGFPFLINHRYHIQVQTDEFEPQLISQASGELPNHSEKMLEGLAGINKKLLL